MIAAAALSASTAHAVPRCATEGVLVGATAHRFAARTMGNNWWWSAKPAMQ